MDMNAAFPSTYLKAADLKGKAVSLIMDRVAFEDVGGEQKPVLYFRGTDRGIVLNKTNTNMIAEMYGYESDDWAGKKVVLHTERVPFQGKLVDSIRVRLEVVKQFVSQPIRVQNASPNGARGALPPQPVSAVDQLTPDEMAADPFAADEIPF